MLPSSDFITDFMALTEGLITPPLFRLWSGIACVAGALERRVWAKTGPGVVFPNLYVLLVAPPGVGKFVVETVRELWQDTVEPGSKISAFHVASDSVTNASLMDELGKSKQTRVVPSGPAFTYHSLLVPCEEFQVLLPGYDQQFIASLNSIYNNKNLHKESRRTGTVKELTIENPHFNILGGAQPSYFASTFPEEAWSTGFARRVVMIYSTESPLRSVFYSPEAQLGLRPLLLRRLSAISQLYGPMLWTPQAAEALDQWHMAGGPPTPTHSKLAHYIRSRTVFIIKLSTISAVSRGNELRIEFLDIERAIEWLTSAEKAMPDIFREMIGKSDNQVLEELHHYLTKLWLKQKQQGHITSEKIFDFLAQRVPSEKVQSLFLLANQTGMIARVAGAQDLYVPRSRDEIRGVE